MKKVYVNPSLYTEDVQVEVNLLDGSMKVDSSKEVTSSSQFLGKEREEDKSSDDNWGGLW